MNPQDTPSEIIGQSPGCDPKSTSATKRNSGLFAFLKWFKPSTSRESINTQNSSSCESLNSTISNGTVASFSYINPSAYPNKVSEKCIILEPETDTYKARLKQRDRRRENDKNLTLRKKYNLFFNRDTFLRANNKEDEESTKSLPLMTRAMEEQEEKTHRRTNSESSKLKKAGAYVHVRGKRRAPQPPGTLSNSSTLSLRRKKRNAPAPPTVEKIKTTPNTEVLFNDCLKLDHGVLKPAKEEVKTEPSSARSSYVSDGPVSPRPWYKRNNTKRESHKYETVEILPEITARNSTVDLTIEETIKQEKPKKEESKRKSGMSFLTNISELDREASEIIKNEHQKNGNDLPEIPEFMRPKGELKINPESWVSPKRRSAKDLIAKFNAITNVTKVTVNTALFGSSQNPRKEHFKKRVSLSADRKQESLLESHKKRIDQIKNNHPLMKSESASAIKTPQPETPKMERKNWNCPKCKLENEYWRIICHVCSAIKPYFDDFSSSKETSTNEAPGNTTGSPEKFLERSKTQIGFSALASYNKNKRVEKSISLEEKTSKESDNTKEEEREKLKKMLIEMKNSLPKRKSNILLKQASNRTSVIMENPENIEENEVVKKEKTSANHKLPEEKVASVLIGTTQTIYENIKVKKSDQPAATKVLSSLQTKVDPSVSNANFIASPIVKAEEIRKEENKKAKVEEIQKQPELLNRELIRKNSYELMRPKDFENIYSDNAAQSPARIYANLARNDELSLFFNMPKNFAELKNNLSKVDENNTDTIEINRLLRRLESAIAKGEMTEAAIYAKELAQLKINCSVVRQKPHPNSKKKGFSIEMYVEDKISHRGPFTLEVIENQTVAELKQQVEQEFEIPVEVQRWILGKELATDDHATLKDHQITSERCPVFLYLVAPSENKLVDTKLNRCKNEEVPSTSKTELNVKNDLKTTVCVEETNDRIPKIVEVIPKVTERIPKIEPGPSTEKTSVHKSTRTIELKTDKNTSGNGFEPKNGVLKKPEVKNDEDDEEYDTKTLRPQPKEWECHLCTLLNPIGSNVCAVCATVKQIEPISSKKSLKKTKAPQPIKKEPKVQTYQQLMNLDNADLVENTETFECVVCFMDILPGQGVTLRECLHQFCKLCLANTIEYTEDAEVKCPYRDDQYSCNIALQDREIKALVTPQVYEHYLAKSVTEAENKIGRSFHCKTPDCRGWCIFEDKVNEFRCPVCTRVNCLTCQAIHIGMNCRQYQEKFKRESEVDDDARRTKDMVDEMVSKGEALTCPTCKVILMKKWGCDWVRCSMCKTEICWVTRGPRWGPAGKGDTSGGCQCGVNGVKCHPQCSYCH